MHVFWPPRTFQRFPKILDCEGIEPLTMYAVATTFAAIMCGYQRTWLVEVPFFQVFNSRRFALLGCTARFFAAASTAIQLRR